jgi:prepilin-type processing-associated H-X9-DG protein
MRTEKCPRPSFRPVVAGSGRPVLAFTLVELLAVLIAAFLLLILFVVAAQRAAGKRARIGCVNNLKMGGLAFRVAGTDHSTPQALPGDGNPANVLPGSRRTEIPSFIFSLTNEVDPRFLTCPADKGRSPARSWSEVSRNNISYFFNLDGAECQPGSLLAGDSNLTTNGVQLPPGIAIISSNSIIGLSKSRHQEAGNVVLGDGSVQQVTPARLAETVSHQPPMKLWVP